MNIDAAAGSSVPSGNGDAEARSRARRAASSRAKRQLGLARWSAARLRRWLRREAELGERPALVGGLDADGLSEIDRASRMTRILAPIARLFARGARAGAVLSPLHGRFPQRTAAQAKREAAVLGAAGAPGNETAASP